MIDSYGLLPLSCGTVYPFFSSSSSGMDHYPASFDITEPVLRAALLSCFFTFAKRYT